MAHAFLCANKSRSHKKGNSRLVYLYVVHHPAGDIHFFLCCWSCSSLSPQHWKHNTTTTTNTTTVLPPTTSAWPAPTIKQQRGKINLQSKVGKSKSKVMKCNPQDIDQNVRTNTSCKISHIRISSFGWVTRYQLTQAEWSGTHADPWIHRCYTMLLRFTFYKHLFQMVFLPGERQINM